MLVVDASVVVDFLRGPGSPAFDRLSESFRSRGVVCAPHLLVVEVAQAIRRLQLTGDFEPEEAETMVHDLADLPLALYPHRFLLRRAFQLRDNVTVYDGVYLALAEALDFPLVTGDTSLNGVPGCDAVVEIISTPR